jgi:molecular chaperone GrpE
VSDKIKEKDETIEEEEQVIEPVDGETAESEQVEETPLSVEDQLAAAQAEATKNLDGWMRAQAEFANARKRMEKQRAETYLNATADMAAKLLPVLDDFERALADIPSDVAANDWSEGIVLVQRKLVTILEGLNIKHMEVMGQPFDPNFHEAILQVASDEYESGFVCQELQKGYQLGDRVIRPSLVYVAE